MNHYNLQSDHLTHINLEAPLENLQWHQQRLQRLAAAVAIDLSVVTDAMIEKGGSAVDTAIEIMEGIIQEGNKGEKTDE